MNTAMEHAEICAILSELLQAEQRALLPRLPESSAFITSDRVADWQRVGSMIDQRDRHLNRLAETIIELGGEPGPPACDIASADFHYVSLPALLPRVLANHEELCRLYDRAAQALAECPPAIHVVTDIAAQHRAWLEHLRQLATATVSNRG